MGNAVNLFNTGKSGLFANRSALATTGHNIANVNTEGYSRQRVEQVANTPQQLGPLVFGSGVRVQQIQRINDDFLTRQISNEMKFLGQYEEKEMALNQAENIFNEITNDGMNRLLTKFFNDFRKLGTEPESEALRAMARESANQLIGDFHRISRSIADIQKNIDSRIESSVRQANELIQRIAHLNGEIRRYETGGGDAPDLKDSRDKAIRELGTLMEITVATNEKNEVTIAASGSGPLLSGTSYNKLTVAKHKSARDSGVPDGSLDVRLEGMAQPIITHHIKNGRLAGLIESRDVILGGASRRMDEIAYTLATKFNEVHRMGFALNGSHQVNFFREPTEIYGAADRMRLSDEVLQDSNYIATALAPDAPGDNRLVQYISNLQHSKIMGKGMATFDDYYNSTVSELATYGQKNKHVLEHQTHIVGQLNKFRESLSGVSLDEETTNLVQFQHAFDASAKVIKVADEVLEEILKLRA